jgi:hypothetical protein
MEKLRTAVHCDGLGNPVVIGNRYGYAINKNGYTHAVVGIATKLNEKGVALKIESARQSLYDDDTEMLKIKTKKEYEWNTIAATINIKGMHLFPVVMNI